MVPAWAINSGNVRGALHLATVGEVITLATEALPRFAEHNGCHKLRNVTSVDLSRLAGESGPSLKHDVLMTEQVDKQVLQQDDSLLVAEVPQNLATYANALDDCLTHCVLHDHSPAAFEDRVTNVSRNVHALQTPRTDQQRCEPATGKHLYAIMRGTVRKIRLTWDGATAHLYADSTLIGTSTAAPTDLIGISMSSSTLVARADNLKVVVP